MCVQNRITGLWNEPIAETFRLVSTGADGEAAATAAAEDHTILEHASGVTWGNLVVVGLLFAAAVFAYRRWG